LPKSFIRREKLLAGAILACRQVTWEIPASANQSILNQ